MYIYKYFLNLNDSNVSEWRYEFCSITFLRTISTGKALPDLRILLDCVKYTYFSEKSPTINMRWDMWWKYIVDYKSSSSSTFILFIPSNWLLFKTNFGPWRPKLWQIVSSIIHISYQNNQHTYRIRSTKQGSIQWALRKRYPWYS